nr:twin-arginine translocation signal domain-containing protein [Bacteroidales bacterium]
MKTKEMHSRRNFIKTAGGASLALAGATVLTRCSNDTPGRTPGRDGTIFKGEPASSADRLERVKLAALGMQRYDWEQGTLGQAFLEMGETDLAISFARGA